MKHNSHDSFWKILLIFKFWLSVSQGPFRRHSFCITCMCTNFSYHVLWPELCPHPKINLKFNSGSGRSPGEGNGNQLQYSCLENSMDRGAWWATVYRVAKSWTRLSVCTQLPLCQSVTIFRDREFTEVSKLKWVKMSLNPICLVSL